MTTPRSTAELRSAGPFITPSGRRLPVRILTPKDVPALLEFHDYRARKSASLGLFAQATPGREGVEALADGTGLDERPIVAIMAGPAALIRGIAQYAELSPGTAEVRFTIDETLDQHGDVASEMLHRVADHARARGFRELSIQAEATSSLAATIEASGFAWARPRGGGGYAISITEMR